MASEAVASTQTNTVEEVEDKLNGEVKPNKQESDSPPKESGDQNPKTEELPSVEPSLPKIEETTVDKLIEEPPASVTILSETEEKTEDKPTLSPVVEKVVKTEHIPVKENSKVAAQDPVHEPDTSSVPETVVDGVKSQPEEQPANESIDKEPKEQPAIESTDIKPVEQPATESVNKEPLEQPETDSITKHPDEQPNIVEVSISSVEAIEKPEEPLKVSPIEEPEAVTVKEREISEAKSIKEETQEPAVPEVEEKPEPTTVAEVVEKPDTSAPKVEEKPEPTFAEVEEKPEPTVAEVEERPDSAVPKVEERPEAAVPVVEEKPEAAVSEAEGKQGEQPIAHNGIVPGEIEKEDVPLPDKIEDITILKEDNICKDREVLASEISDHVVSVNQEAQADSKGDEGNSTPSVVENVGGENIEKEATGVSVVEGLLKEAVVELAKDEPIKVEDVDGTVSTAEVTTTSVEGESKSRDVDLLPENKEEDIKDEKPASGEVNKEEATEEKMGESTAAVNKEVVEPRESKLEVKADETVKAEADKLEKEEVDETVKLDVPNPEPSSELGDDTKTSEDLPKEVPAKPTQKHSNNILTKVKKSLVKAKKAILGKSPSSKTITAETKGDIEVK